MLLLSRDIRGISWHVCLPTMHRGALARCPICSLVLSVLTEQGQYQPSHNASVCLDCQPGTFGNNTGLTVCSSCPKGRYQPTSRQTTCRCDRVVGQCGPIIAGAAVPVRLARTHTAMARTSAALGTTECCGANFDFGFRAVLPARFNPRADRQAVSSAITARSRTRKDRRFAARVQR